MSSIWGVIVGSIFRLGFGLGFSLRCCREFLGGRQQAQEEAQPDPQPGSPCEQLGLPVLGLGLPIVTLLFKPALAGLQLGYPLALLQYDLLAVLGSVLPACPLLL